MIFGPSSLVITGSPKSSTGGGIGGKSSTSRMASISSSTGSGGGILLTSKWSAWFSSITSNGGAINRQSKLLSKDASFPSSGRGISEMLMGTTSASTEEPPNSSKSVPLSISGGGSGMFSRKSSSINSLSFTGGGRSSSLSSVARLDSLLSLSMEPCPMSLSTRFTSSSISGVTASDALVSSSASDSDSAFARMSSMSFSFWRSSASCALSIDVLLDLDGSGSRSRMVSGLDTVFVAPLFIIIFFFGEDGLRESSLDEKLSFGGSRLYITKSKTLFLPPGDFFGDFIGGTAMLVSVALIFSS